MGRPKIAYLTAVALSAAACASTPSAPPTDAGPANTQAMAIVQAITKQGFSAPNPRDTTAKDCGEIRCDQSVVTDTVTVRSFGTNGRAEIYAKPLGLDQVASVVVSFAPTVPQAEQARYWAAIQKLLI
jgi:hypothetical protein